MAKEVRERMSDLNDLLQTFQLSRSDLEIQCDDTIFLSLIKEIDFDITASSLGFTQTEIEEIRLDCSSERKRKMKMLWEWTKKNGSNATYLVLIEAFARIPDHTAVEFVMQHVKKQQQQALSSAAITEDHGKKYPDWDALSNANKSRKKWALIKERQSIGQKFGSLVLDILKSFEKRKINVKQLKIYLLCYGVSTLLAYFESATTLEDVFVALSKSYSSWFNIQLLKVIVIKFGSGDDQKLITEYEAELVPFLQHSIFKIPSRSFAPGHEGAGLTSLYLFLPDNRIPTGQDVAEIQHNVSKQLGIPDGILQFIGYEEGSVILIFAVPEVMLCMDIPNCYLKQHITVGSSKHTYTLNVDLTCIL